MSAKAFLCERWSAGSQRGPGGGSRYSGVVEDTLEVTGNFGHGGNFSGQEATVMEAAARVLFER